MLGSNQRPPPCKGDALPAELTDYIYFYYNNIISKFTPKVKFEISQLSGLHETADLQKKGVCFATCVAVARGAGLEPTLYGVKVRRVTNYTTREYHGGPSWIRTRELRRDQIYSLAVLTTHPKTHINGCRLRRRAFCIPKWYTKKINNKNYYY